MAEVINYDPSTHIAFKKHHVAVWCLIALLLIGVAVGGGLWYGNDVTTDASGRTVITVPSLNDVKGQVVKFKTPQGPAVDAVVEPPAQPAPNGQRSATTDGFGAEGRFQRTEEKTNRYDPIDRLTAAVKATNDNVAKTNDSVEALAGQVKTLDGNVRNLTGKVDQIDTRVSKLEKKAATPAPAPAPEVHQSSVPPVAGPQASVPESRPEQVAQGQGPDINFDRSGLPAGWHITGVHDQQKAERCQPPKTLHISTDPRRWIKLPHGGIRRPLVCE